MALQSAQRTVASGLLRWKACAAGTSNSIAATVRMPTTWCAPSLRPPAPEKMSRML